MSVSYTNKHSLHLFSDAASEKKRKQGFLKKYKKEGIHIPADQRGRGNEIMQSAVVAVYHIHFSFHAFLQVVTTSFLAAFFHPSCFPRRRVCGGKGVVVFADDTNALHFLLSIFSFLFLYPLVFSPDYCSNCIRD